MKSLYQESSSNHKRTHTLTCTKLSLSLLHRHTDVCVLRHIHNHLNHHNTCTDFIETKKKRRQRKTMHHLQPGTIYNRLFFFNYWLKHLYCKPLQSCCLHSCAIEAYSQDVKWEAGGGGGRYVLSPPDWFCIKMGSNVNQFAVSSTVEGNSPNMVPITHWWSQMEHSHFQHLKKKGRLHHQLHWCQIHGSN